MTGGAADHRGLRRRSALFGAALGLAASVALLVVLAVGLGSVDIAATFLDDTALSEEALGEEALGDERSGEGLGGARLGSGRLAELLGGADGPIAARVEERLQERVGEVRGTLVRHLGVSAAAGIAMITATGAAAGWWHGGRLAATAAAATRPPRSRPRR